MVPREDTDNPPGLVTNPGTSPHSYWALAFSSWKLRALQRNEARSGIRAFPSDPAWVQISLPLAPCLGGTRRGE
jgi:hypothetical protein